MENATVVRQFADLADLRKYREELKKELRSDEDKIAAEWHKLFDSPNARGRSVAQRRMSNMMSVGFAVFDGVLLSRKLYKKYKYGIDLFKRRRR